jgi:hypothetical protein
MIAVRRDKFLLKVFREAPQVQIQRALPFPGDLEQKEPHAFEWQPYWTNPWTTFPDSGHQRNGVVPATITRSVLCLRRSVTTLTRFALLLSVL